MLTRSSGVLMHITSLPSRFGIGDFGPAGHAFVDFLAKADQRYWQILPLNPTDPVYGNSPYSSPSAFAMNTILISPQLLVEEGWLKPREVSHPPVFSKAQVDYPAVANYKNTLLDRAYEVFRENAEHLEDYQAFCREHTLWLEDYAVFVVLKAQMQGRIWTEWPENLRGRDPHVMKEFKAKFAEEIDRIQFRQFCAFRQWQNLKDYARYRRVEIVGDIPIYVSMDSADVWSQPAIFKLDEHLQPRVVAGVPPDYFSETGQRWGNPIYDWDELKKTGYDWWVKRIRHNLKLFSVIRVDHFRGFVGYWQIPASEKTAVKGEWVKGPGAEFFEFLQKAVPKLSIIAEDLGIITPDVVEAMERFQFPGMKVLLFAFDSDDPAHPYLPHNFIENCVVYTGTHDNNTVRGWFEKDASTEAKKNLEKYLEHGVNAQEAAEAFVLLAMKSRAVLAIVPLQDWLGLGHEARMNTPATIHGNWQWRAGEEMLTDDVNVRIKSLTEVSKRG